MMLGAAVELADDRRCRLAGQARLLTVALVVVAVCSSASAEQPTVASLLKRLDLVDYRAGTRPPDFSGPTLDARPLSLTDLRGKVIVVNFWASWCMECRAEMPALEALHRQFASRGLAVIGLNVREGKQAISRYTAELGLTFPFVLDPDGRTNDLYGVIGLPTTFVVGRDGRAVAFGVGPRDWKSPAARTLIEILLTEPVPRAP